MDLGAPAVVKQVKDLVLSLQQAQVPSLAREFPYAMRAAEKRKKFKTKENMDLWHLEANARCVYQHQQRLKVLLQVTSCPGAGCTHPPDPTPDAQPSPSQPRPSLDTQPDLGHSDFTEGLKQIFGHIIRWHYRYSCGNSLLGPENKEAGITCLHILFHVKTILCATN